MQIRVANRQDEPTIRQIVSNVNAEMGLPEADPQGKDSDLNNVDAKYFWNDGICVVAEDEGDIVGLAAARRGDAEDTLELVRLAVQPDRRHQGIATKLLDTIFFFARNAEYRRIVFYPDKQGVIEKQPLARFVADPEHAERLMHPVVSWRELQEPAR